MQADKSPVQSTRNSRSSVLSVSMEVSPVFDHFHSLFLLFYRGVPGNVEIHRSLLLALIVIAWMKWTINRYLFGCGEGTQRLFAEWKLRLR